MNRVQMQFRFFRGLCLPVASLLLVCLAGCTENGSLQSTDQGTSPGVVEDVHAHAHPTEGPHHGDLVELGSEEFHAEVVHGDGGNVTVYILDSAATAVVPIDASELTINITHDGKAEQFKLPADRDSSDPDGKSSRFMLRNKELASDLDSHDAEARLVVMINGKSYSGKIAHNHDASHVHDDGHKH